MGAVQVLSCDCFWWDAARGETRESIQAPSTPGRLGYLAMEWLMDDAEFRSSGFLFFALEALAFASAARD
ncbi:MAG: hypothetical protein PHW87_02295 [Methanothrix sp.]|nr:hypothetical protein [Methanothrix sp.]